MPNTTGDAIAVIGIFSDEANQAIEKHGWLGRYPLTSSIKPIAGNQCECLFGLYNLTK